MEKKEDIKGKLSLEFKGQDVQSEGAKQTLGTIAGADTEALIVVGLNGGPVYSFEGAEDFYRVIVETMTEGVITLTGDGKIDYSNCSFAAMLKMPRDQVIGSAMDRLVQAADLPKYETLLHQGRAGNSKGEIRLQTGDGSILPAYFSVGRLEGTSAALLCAIVTDLTEQKRNHELRVAAELERTKWAEAESARQRIGKILECVTDAFFTLDREWRITDVNWRVVDIYGTREELIG